MSKEQERLKEISEKKESLEAELRGGQATEERLGEIRTEIESLSAEEKEVRSKMELNEANTQKVEETKMSDKELRAKQFVESGKMQTRAVLSTGTIAKPTRADGISDLADVAADIVDDVNAIPLTGSGAWVVAYKKTDAVAVDVTDGSAVGGTGADFDYVTINPAEVGVVDQVSNQVKKMTPVNYLDAVEKSALIALRTKMSAKIIAALAASALVETKKGVALDSDFLKNLALNFRAVKTKGAVCLYLAQADLLTLGKVRGTNEKKAVYEITFDANTTTAGVIKEGGLAVRFRVLDSLAAGTQYFGQPKAIDMPMWDNYEISTDEGGKYFENNQIGVRGLQTANADLVAYHAMQKITQAS